MKKVVILQYRLLHYRVALFDLLKARCAEMGVELSVVHGQPTNREKKKDDIGFLSWSDQIKNRFVSIAGRDLLWQPIPFSYINFDLVIIMQENRILSNYPLIFFRRFLKPRVAYWGHGRNLQSVRPEGVLERWKRFLVCRVDWWFAYTSMTKDLVVSDGFPDGRISVLNNAIDNQAFEEDLGRVSSFELNSVRESLGIPIGAKVAVFCGSLYVDKKLDFMVQAADLIKKKIPEFFLIVIGDGPDSSIIRDASESRSWLSWVGVKKGSEKALFFRLGEIVFNPGAVGLHILDSFCAGLPMVTTREARHGPEISYLENERNALIVSGSADAYADAVIKVFSDGSLYSFLRMNALADAKRYSLNNMVERFAIGIKQSLSEPRNL